MKNRTVKALLFAEEYPMGKIRVKQPFPSIKIEQIDPFILLHHAELIYTEGENLKHEGVGPHPHRGFSPVTFIFKGGVHHQDSRGNNNVVYEGGTQWMHAGMGVIHSERPPEDLMEHGGRQEFIQLWVNTPAAKKMKQPEYFPLSAANTPFVLLEDNRSRVNIIAGKLLGIKGPIPSISPVNAATAFLHSDISLKLDIPIDHNCFIYLLDGEIKIEEFGMVSGLHAVLFNNDGEGITIKAIKDTRLLFVSGTPLNEPLATHGPFVMNTETQLLEAMRDYKMGKMGILIEN